jgi:hypothetical protein
VAGSHEHGNPLGPIKGEKFIDMRFEVFMVVKIEVVVV